MPDTLGPEAVGTPRPSETSAAGGTATDAVIDATQDAELRLRRLRADTDKAELELQKLRADITKAQVEAAAAPAAPGLERLRVYLAAVTSLGAVLTVGGIIYQQQAQAAAQRRSFEHADALQHETNRREDASRRAAEVAALTREFGGAAAPVQRIAAIAGLAAYGGDATLRPGIQRLLIESMRVTDAPDVRDAALDALVGMADSSSLSGLAQANRRVRARVREHLARDLNPDDLDRLSDLRVEAWTPAFLTADTALGRLVRDLDWYADALVRSVNAVGLVRRQDFHNVVFTPLRLRPDGDAASGAAIVVSKPHTYFRAGIRFAHVHFEGAVLAEQFFDGVTIDTAWFGNAALPGSLFRASVVRYTDLTDVRTVVGDEATGAGTARDGSLLFEDCSLEHVRLAPRPVPGQRRGGAPTDAALPADVRLTRTRWVRVPSGPGTRRDSLPGDSSAVLAGVLVIPRAPPTAGAYKDTVTIGPAIEWRPSRDAGNPP